jgi:hypothetical protein
VLVHQDSGSCSPRHPYPKENCAAVILGGVAAESFEFCFSVSRPHPSCFKSLEDKIMLDRADGPLIPLT